MSSVCRLGQSRFFFIPTSRRRAEFVRGCAAGRWCSFDPNASPVVLATGSWVTRRLARLEWLDEKQRLSAELTRLSRDLEGRLLLLLPEAREIAIRAIATARPQILHLSRPAYFSMRRGAGGRGVNEIVRGLPFGRVRLRAWTETGGPGFRAGESLMPLTRRTEWSPPWTSVLVFAKDTPFRVMRLKPQLELWPPNVEPIGHRWRKLESLIPDPDVIL